MTEEEDAAYGKALEEAESNYMDAQRWGHMYREAQETLDRIQPLYAKFYKNPFFWFYRPLDEELDGKTLVRCKTCNKLFWMDGPTQYTTHKHHHYSRAGAQETGVWEYLKARYLRMIK